MSRQRESNPHFFPPERSQPPAPRSQPRHGSTSHFPTEAFPPERSHPPERRSQPPERRSQPQHGSTYYFPTEPQPQAPSQHKNHTPETHHGSSTPVHTQLTPLHPTPSNLIVPKRRKTKPFAWIVAAFCVLFWIIIIVGGLIVLIIYLVFRPRSPKFDIATASLNAAYLDMGYLLNADITLLANFTNANRKVNIDFSYVVMDLYFQQTFIATTYVQPLTVMNGKSRLEVAHITPSQVRLSLALSQELQRQIDNGRVRLQIKGLIRARSKLGGIFRYSYWLYSNCDLILTGPPNGVLIGRRCITKR